MDLVELLEQRAQSIVNVAMESMSRAHMRHYEGVGTEETCARLQRLFDLMVQCLKTRRLEPMADHGQHLARERYAAGFNLVEVQTAFNVVEEATWQVILRDIPPDELGKAIGLISTVLGAGKDALACTFVQMATQGRSSVSLDVEALFKGTDKPLEP